MEKYIQTDHQSPAGRPEVPEFPPPSYEAAIKKKDQEQSRINSSTADFGAHAVPAGYEDYNSDNEYLDHWL